MKTKKKRLIPKQIKQSAREAGAREMQKNTRISFYLVPIMCSSWFCFPLNLTRHLCVFFSTFFRLQAFSALSRSLILFFPWIYLFVCQMEFMRFASLSCCLCFQVNRCIRSQILSHCIPLFFCLFVILTVRCVDALVDFVVVVLFSLFLFSFNGQVRCR